LPAYVRSFFALTYPVHSSHFVIYEVWNLIYLHNHYKSSYCYITLCKHCINVFETLIGEHPTDIIKQHTDSDILSLLLGREKKLCVGRKLGDSSSYYVLCPLQHHIVYLKYEILEETDNEIKFTITSLKGNELKKLHTPWRENAHGHIRITKHATRSQIYYSWKRRPGK
jgi:hypothetical protein